jgi:hypothetical protein
MPDGEPSRTDTVETEIADRSATDDAGETDGEEPTLNPLLIQAARRAQWTDDEINELIDSSPEVAERTFTRLLQSMNDVAAEYGRIGAAAMDHLPQQMGVPPVSQTIAPQQQVNPGVNQFGVPQHGQIQQEGDNLLASIYGERLPQLTESYGKDAIQDLIQPLVTNLLEPVRQLQAEAQRQRTEATAQEVSTFFGGLPEEMKGLYGSGSQVSGEQYESRQQLARLADQIYTGAASQGLTLSIGECLDKASMLHASGHLAGLERRKITEQVRRRSKQKTQRPTSRRRQPIAAGEKSEAAATQAYIERAAELGMDITGG